ncbi:MAG: hypothetical protein KC516_00360 [Nanoarchaeota archaeon]|nr:hypothetical protein [Nanoarchaeota archaeon]
MEKAYLECSIQEGNRTDTYEVLIPLSNGSRLSGPIKKRHFNERGELEVKIAGISDYNATVILPQRINHSDFITVDFRKIAN